MPNTLPGTSRESGSFLLTTLGGASLQHVPAGGDPVEALGPGKPLALVVYLAFSPGQTATREHLIDLLWADLDLEAARHALRQTLWYLRQRLGPDAICPHDASLTLRAAVESDRDAFLDAIDRLDFEHAVELYRGDFLPVFAAPGGADFEHWADLERDRLRIFFLRAAEVVVRERLSKGHFKKAKELAARARDTDPYNETTWRLLLEALLAANDRVGAEIEAHALEKLLAEEDRPPESATRALLALVREAPTEAETATTKRTLVAELIAREREFSTTISAWETARRGAGLHMHVTGAPGLGKSRLLADVNGRLRAMGARVVQVRANPGERQVPYVLAAELAAALAKLPGAAAVSQGAASALVALNPSLSAQYSAPPDRAADLEALRHRELALAELLTTVADKQPVALLIDDVHWADPTSRQILQSLVAKLSDHPVLAVTTARPGPEGAIASGGSAGLTLNPLSDQETAALLASLGSLPAADWAGEIAQELHAATHGSPLLILETLHLALERGWLVLQDGVWACADPATLHAELARGGALRRRIGELSRHEAWLLLLLAAAGTPLDARFLTEASERDASDVLNDLLAMEVRGLVTRDGQEWQPAHDEIAARACEIATADAIRAAHGAIGRTLAEGAGNDRHLLYRAGRHLAQSGDDTQLHEVFARWVTIVRRHGDRRSSRRLALELLNGSAEPARVRCLVRNLPLHIRLGLTSRKRALLAAGLAGTPIALLTALLLKEPSPPPDAFLLVLRRTPTAGVAAHEVPIRRAG